MIGSVCFKCGEMIAGRYKNIALDGKYHSNLWFHNEDDHQCYAEIVSKVQEYLLENIEKIIPYNFGIPTKQQRWEFRKMQNNILDSEE